jgi:nucleotide-binding universal stress UspA family protein
MYKHILCPLDGSKPSRSGMTEAVHLAKALGAKIRFLNVVDTFLYMTDPQVTIDMGVIDNLRGAGKKMLKEAMEFASSSGVQADSQLVEASGFHVADAIVDEAKKWRADLIVMGTHGRRGFKHLVMGSDAETVIKLSNVPVLLTRRE